MKREGRQHGMVRSFCSIPSPLNPNPRRRVINKLDTPPTAGLFTKVTSKPTNHSKFTGRCGKPKCSDCHMQPACKSKDKAKGSQKLKSATDSLELVEEELWCSSIGSQFQKYHFRSKVQTESNNILNIPSTLVMDKQ
ncbi:hypothetical protein ACET3Z_014333 [Daucus carota]